MPLLGLSLGPNVGWAAVGLNSLGINISRSIGPDAGLAVCKRWRRRHRRHGSDPLCRRHHRPGCALLPPGDTPDAERLSRVLGCAARCSGPRMLFVIHILLPLATLSSRVKRGRGADGLPSRTRVGRGQADAWAQFAGGHARQVVLLRRVGAVALNGCGHDQVRVQDA